MTNKEAIKYLQQLYPNGGHCWLDEQRIEAIGIAINALQEEPVSKFLNTESMIESYKQRLISQANGMKNSPLIDMCLVSYKHGINETLDTLNLSNVQRTVKNWKEEPVSEELEEAAMMHFKDAMEYEIKTGLKMAHMTSFKAGAKWQKEQMMAKAVDGEVTYGKSLAISSLGFVLDKEGFDFGDKVKVIVIKED